MAHLTLHSVFAVINVRCIYCLVQINFNGFVLFYLCLTCLESFVMPRVRQRRNYRQLSEFDRGRIVGLREGGFSYREIANRLNRNQSTIMRCYQSWTRDGQERRRRGTGGRRKTNGIQDRRLRLMALRDRFSSTRSIADVWLGNQGRPVTIRTVYRRIRGFGLKSYRPHLVLPLTAQHRQQRLEWCRLRMHWIVEWHKVVFSDESRFCLGMHDGRMRVRRRRGERRDIQFSVERHVHRAVGIMVWGAIAYGSRSQLVFIQATMNAQRYIDEVIEPHIIPYLQQLEDPLFQQDNATPHVARISINRFEEANVNILPWPPKSPDLSPIEHVWDIMGRKIRNLANPPQTLIALRHELQVAWDTIPQEDIDHLIESMPRRVRECVTNRGGSTHY